MVCVRRVMRRRVRSVGVCVCEVCVGCGMFGVCIGCVMMLFDGFVLNEVYDECICLYYRNRNWLLSLKGLP